MVRLTVKQVLAASAGLGLVGGIVYLSHRSTTKVHPRPQQKIEALATSVPDLKAYIDSNKDDRRQEIQDKVGNARFRLAYAVAHANPGKESNSDYEAARHIFLTAATEYKGKARMGADFGGIPDAAQYQAIACLTAEHKDVEAAMELRKFIKDYPLSPLCKAAYKRLVRMNGGKATPELDGLLQVAVNAQEKHTRFEMSVCGPKAIEAILPLLGKPSKDYKELAKLCGTTDKGTTIEGMRKGLKSLGVQSYGFELNAVDFRHMAAPAILLRMDHYVLVKEIRAKDFTVYDPSTELTSTLTLPKADDANFFADVITFSLPDLASN